MAIGLVHSMRKEPFDQFVRAQGTGTICKVEGPAGNVSQI